MAQPSPGIDYVVIGHLTQDVDDEGRRQPGGTVAYSALTARALDQRAAVVSAHGPEANLGPLEGFPIEVVPSAASSTFRNVYSSTGRRQRMLERAAPIPAGAVPRAWLGARVVHLGPVADEVDPTIARLAREAGAAFVGMTPQGWMRCWDEDGTISRRPWREVGEARDVVDAVVLSEEDLDHDEARLDEVVSAYDLVAVTRGAAGVRLFRLGREVSRIEAPRRRELDPTGAGDIYATVFFTLLARGRALEESARAAVELAADSVQRPGLEGVPSAAAARALLGTSP